MKKTVLSAVLVFATAFPIDASAIPAFSRQTGLNCSGCHAQPIPLLNAFGRTFKAEGYIRMGAPRNTEGEWLPLPQSLNAALLFKYGYRKSDGSEAVFASGGGTTVMPGTNEGHCGTDDLSLYFGGRITDGDYIRIGFLNRNDLVHGHVADLRVPIVLEAVEFKLSAIPFTTRSLGVQYGYELSSGGVLRSGHWSVHRRETSAIQYNADLGEGGTATGNAFVLQHDLFYLNYTLWSSSFVPGANGIASTRYGQRYLRLVVTPVIADYRILAGIGRMSGSSYGNQIGGDVESRQTFIDVQAQGEVDGLGANLFLQQARAPVCGASITASIGTTGVCAYNGTVVAGANTYGVTERKATTLGTSLALIPHTLSVGVALRKASNGGMVGSNGDDAKTLSATFDLLQNIALHLDYSSYSGSAHDLVNAQKSRLTIQLEAAL